MKAFYRDKVECQPTRQFMWHSEKAPVSRKREQR